MLKKILNWGGILLLVALLISIGGYGYVKLQMPHHSTPSSPPEAIPLSGDRVLDSIRQGLAYLKSRQEADGHFVAGDFSPKPAFTSLVVDAFVCSPDHPTIADTPFLQKAVDAILSEQKPSGAIFHDIPRMSFSSYSTAVVLVALNHADKERLAPQIAKATEFLKGGQIQSDKPASNGGFGYGPAKNADGSAKAPGSDRPDLSNTCTILEALEASGVPKSDPVWKNVEAFITNCQNRTESNKQPWVEFDDGGFIYNPSGLEKGKLGRDGNPMNASYGAMSYAGLVSFLYANVDKKDPRVQSAFQWIRTHYDLNENVGRKENGLYFYYRLMAKALSKYGERYVVTPDGVKHDWAEELAARLVRLQRADGSWVNTSKAFLEDDPIMVTAYMVRALSTCYDRMKADAVTGATREHEK